MIHSNEKIISFFEVDATSIVADSYFYFTNEVIEGQNFITFDGIDYMSYPVKIEGFEKNIEGRFPEPTITFANINGYITGLIQIFNGFRGCPVIRRRIYYDDVDNPSLEFIPDKYFISRYNETSLTVTLYLQSLLDRGNFQIPARRVIQLL